MVNATPEKKKVYFIVVDGPDGVGKTTLLNRLVNYFNSSSSYRAISLSPSNTEFGQEVKAVLKKHPLPTISQYHLHVATLHHLEARLEYLRRSAKKDLIVFLDRWYITTGVYQGYAAGTQEIPFFLGDTRNLTKPDATFILNATDEILNERLSSRQGEKDIYEETEFQRKVREGYRKIFEYKDSGCTQVNVNGTVEENFKTLLSAVIHRLH